MPELDSSTPATILKRVLLPQPLGPMSVTNSPVLTVMSIASSVSRRLRPFTNVLVTPCTSNLGESVCSNMYFLLPFLNNNCWLARLTTSRRVRSSGPLQHIGGIAEGALKRTPTAYKKGRNPEYGGLRP